MGLRTALESIDRALWSDARVRFKPVETEADLFYATYECELGEEQRELVNPAWYSIGRAYLRREDNFPCLILNENGDPVGFISLCKWLAAGDAYSWSFYIDRNQQGKGYGRSAAQLAVRILKAADPYKPIKLAAESDNVNAQKLYLSLGFTKLPEKDGDDLVFGL